MHSTLFDNQPSWGEKPAPDPKIFEEYAKQLGMDMEKYKTDVTSQEVKDRGNRDKASGDQLGDSGTP